MITAGIDAGAKTIKAVIVGDGVVTGQSLVPAGFNTRESAEKAYHQALAAAGVKREDVKVLIATGAGRKEVPGTTDTVTEVGADARGVAKLFPSARTVIDVGAEEGRAVRIDQAGKVQDFAVNEKCAAGAGAFTEAMARALEVPLDELGEFSLTSTKAVPMNAQCTVFAESEVVTLVHAKTPKADIARAVHDAIADRITSTVRRVGISKDVALVGGVARNIGFVKSLEEDLELKLLIPPDPEFVGALGAALIAAEKN
jgi:benzoyl-CoA reductase subunit D